jgi:NTE family protein
MNVHVRPESAARDQPLPFECAALVLRGGGAQRAYRARVYEALAEAGINPDWVGGVSIGAINGALIAATLPKLASRSCAPFGKASPPTSKAWD